MITYMVVNGFSLLDLKKLYIDEMYVYYEELFHVLEKTNKIKEGSYDKIRSSNNKDYVENTVDILRRQMFKSIADKNKTK